MNPQPQITTAQLRHAAENGEKLVQAKMLELTALRALRNDAIEAIRTLFGESLGQESQRTLRLTDAATNLLTSKIERGAIDWEILELQLKAAREYLRQAESLIEVPNLQPPNQRH